MSDQTLALVYDRECPVCSAYTKFLTLKKLNENFELINARSDHPLVQYLIAQKYDLDEGMVFVVGQNIHHGAAAINVLSQLTSRGSVLNRLNYWLFRSRLLSNVLYPVLKLGRNTLLMLLGRKSIRQTRAER